MNLNIKTTNTTLTPAISDYVEKKIGMLNKFVNLEGDNVFIQAEVGKTTRHHKSGDFFRAEVNIRVGGKNYRAVSEKDDLYAAIDEVKDELAEEIKSGKERQISVVRRGALKLKNMLKGLGGGDRA
jgi:putative sigma-54 modulation protein